MKALTRFNAFTAAALASVLAIGSAALVYSEGGANKPVAPMAGAPAGKPAVPLSAGEKQAVSHAMTLSEAFRAASDRVLPAVVSIQHTTEPKLVKHDVAPISRVATVRSRRNFRMTRCSGGFSVKMDSPAWMNRPTCGRCPSPAAARG